MTCCERAIGGTTGPLGRRIGARWHLVRASRNGAPVRPTIAAGSPGRVGH